MPQALYYPDLNDLAARVRQIQSALQITPDGVIGNEFMTAVEERLGLKRPVVLAPLPGRSCELSAESIQLIVRFETGGRSYYENFLSRPTWPGYSSGVTIGVGYDLGYKTLAGFRAEWRDILTPSHLDALSGAIGVRGAKAERLIPGLRHIQIGWNPALTFFMENTLPEFCRITLRSFPNAIMMRPHALGALVSLVFNRGTSVTGDSRSEMLAISRLIAKDRTGFEDGEYSRIADLIRDMKRLWKRVNGTTDLHGRRDSEAAMMENESEPSSVQQVSF